MEENKYLVDYSNLNRFAILQLSEAETIERGKRYSSFSENEKYTADDYEISYFEVGEPNVRVDLDTTYARFNGVQPDNYYGHSLSVSDVVLESYNGEISAYYVDSVGFKKLDNEFLTEKIEKRFGYGLDVHKELEGIKANANELEAGLENGYNAKDREDYLLTNYSGIFALAKMRGVNNVLNKNQEKLKAIYEAEGEVPFPSVSVKDGVYLLNDVEGMEAYEIADKIDKLYEQRNVLISFDNYTIQGQKKLIAVECTSDYSDDTFRTNMNNTKGFGKEEYYRLVTVNEDGFVVPIDDEVYLSGNEAKTFINSDSYEQINYDDMINLAIQMRSNKLYDSPHREDVKAETDNPYTPSSDELSEDERKREAILQGVGAVMDSEGFANYAKTIKKLMYNKFSPRNCGLILNQYIAKYCEENKIDVLKLSNEEMGQVINKALESENVPTYLMGYEAWKDYGRQVTGKNVAYSIVAPNYVSEYQGKGTIIRAMEKKFNQDFAKDGNRDYSEFSLGNTGLSFRSYGQKGNHLVDICLKGNTILGKQSIEDVRKYLDNEVIGKMVNGYSVTYVYDVKNTVVPEHLWVKNNFKKTELVNDEKGQPVTRHPYKNSNTLEYKIVNTEERQAKFNPNLSMEVTGLTEEKASILFETLKEVSAKKGVPMTVETIDGGSRGFYHTEQRRIAISDKLDTVSKCATAIHEIAHADLHSMPNTKSRGTKEVEAEAVSYMTSQHFGITTDVKSFNYLASWSKGRDLKELESSMNVILKESKKLETEISKELENRGYTLSLDKIGAVENKVEENKQVGHDEHDNSKDNAIQLDELYVKFYKEFVLSETTNVSSLKENAKSLLADTSDERCTNIIKEQIDLLNKQNRKIITVDNNLNQLEKASSQADVDKISQRINKHFAEYMEFSSKFKALSYEYVDRLQDIKNMEKASVRDRYNADPIQTMKDYIKTSDNEEFKKLTDKDLKYIATSGYMNSNFGKLVSEDMDKFLTKGAERLEIVNDVKSKNGQFVEITYCEQWFDKPIVEDGSLIHPATANKIFGEAEKDINQLKEVAEKNGDYIPYSKCRFTLYTDTKDELLATSSRMDVGDGTQTDLSSFLEQDCSDVRVMEAYSKSVKERVKDKIFEPSNERPANAKVETQINPHGEDEHTTATLKLSSEELKNFVTNLADEHEQDTPNADHTKQKQHDRGSLNK